MSSSSNGLAALPCSSAPASILLLLGACAGVAAALEAQTQTFLRRDSSISPELLVRVEALFGDHRSLLEPRWAIVEAAMRPDFDASPKSSIGRISIEVAKPLIRSYFASWHGWRLQGLERTDLVTGSSTPRPFVHILQHGAPEVANLLESWPAGRGFSLGDISAITLSFEWSILQRSLELLDAAYALNRLPARGELGESDLRIILQSYLLLFRQGSHADLKDVEKHQRMRARATEYRGWQDIVALESRTVAKYARPASGLYSRADAQALVLSLALAYGQWQDQECQSMKVDLRGMDRNHSGTVPFESFSAFEGDPHYGYRFRESVDYLRRLGALEEQPGGDQQNVVIANYLQGPSNCIASSAYVSVCCIDECARALSKLEQLVRGPKERVVAQLWSTAAQLFSLDEAPAAGFAMSDKGNSALVQSDGAVGLGGFSRSLSKKSMLREDAATAKRLVFPPASPASRQQPLHAELLQIAGSGGEVDLRSDAFARWLHRALPHDCPRLSTAQELPAQAMTVGASARDTPLYMV